MTDAIELIERVLEGEDPDDVLDSLDEDLQIEELLAYEYFNPYTESWETIDEIDEDLLDEADEWDLRPAELTEDDFLEKAGRIRRALRFLGRHKGKIAAGAGLVGAGVALAHPKSRKYLAGTRPGKFVARKGSEYASRAAHRAGYVPAAEMEKAIAATQAHKKPGIISRAIRRARKRG